MVQGAALDLDRSIVTRDGWRLRIRPIWPEDAPALIEMAERSTPEDLRLRFFTPVRLDHGTLAARLTRYDHDRQIAVAAWDPASPRGEGEFLAVMRLICAPDDSSGEFAVMVRSDLKGHGVGRRLMEEMLGWAVARGLPRVEGVVLAENRAMLHMVRACGGVVEPYGDDFPAVRVRFDPAVLDPAG